MTPRQRTNLEQEARNLRSKFLRTLEALEQRRHVMFNLKMQAKRHAAPISYTSLALILAGVGGVALIVRRRNTPEYKLKKAWGQTRKAIDKTLDQSVHALAINMGSLRKYWKKNLAKDLAQLM